FLASSEDTVMADVNPPASALYYIVTAVDVHQNQSSPSNEASVGATTGVGNLPPVSALTVLPNHPNPFTERTELSVGLPSKADIRVEMFDVAGRRVRAISLEQRAAGWQRVPFDGRDDRGRPLPSGVYFYRVHAGGESAAHKMVIAR
ncbi:MAG TPA: FlgD immunoglobulin-like domain containing protein, partial [Candidatus Krumholzibacteria bacterium]|nr:FlgD immunoglobulin-like domain containing protein [Candidatus Krumholzibacteria bacterium]